MQIELLSPAKNLDYGREAINHGADAVYIGAPAFGARQAATNSIDDIEALVRYAHIYRAKVFATVNTILFDDELDDAVRMIRRLYEAGVDALIIQDMGLLECDLPPIALHASTQCHNADVDRVKFMESVGFKRIILARETSLDQMRQLREATSVELESFVHGALCVSYSGQCYMSQYLCGRSGNRGCCSQPCRSSYTLTTADGRTLLHDKHLLSLRDFSAASSIRAMAEAGICSFKIEGRLKDIGYLKNITAYYRKLLDKLMPDFTPSSSGTSNVGFEPDPERTFNRGYTSYFLTERQPMASLTTQKSLGKCVGKVTAIERNSLQADLSGPLAPGDGLCFLASDGELQGFLVNHTAGDRIIPNRMPNIAAGTPLWRNHDHLFERQLLASSPRRKIGIESRFSRTDEGFALRLVDADAISFEATLPLPATPADNPSRSRQTIVAQLSKLGDTPFEALAIVDETDGHYFLPTSALNQLRRAATEGLVEARVEAFRPVDVPLHRNDTRYPTARVDYRGNIVNNKAEDFYRRHGVEETERGVEQTSDYEGKALMTTKYCLRYELGCCLQGKHRGKPQISVPHDATLYLNNNGRRFRLEFDCKRCQMRIYASQP